MPRASGGLQKLAEADLRIAPRAVREQRVERVIILDRVEAPGKPGVVNRIEEDPIEAHPGDAIKVLLPRVNGPASNGKRL